MTPILPLMQTLTALDSSGKQRNAASRQLEASLRERGRSLPGRGLGRVLSEADLDDVIQHVLVQASTGTARCQASTEAEAWAWCKIVARHYVLDLIEHGQREIPLTGDDKSEPFDGPHEDFQLQKETSRVLQQATENSKRSARGREKESSVACAVEYLFDGASIDEQIARWGFPGGQPARASPTDLRRARDRVYAYRSRGVLYLLEALDGLVQQSELTPADTEFLRKLLCRKKK